MTSASGLTPEEEKTLQDKLPKDLEKNGANNKSKAKYVKLISDCVIGSTNSKFFSMQPRVKNHSQDERWKAVYYIIFKLLDDFNLNLTKEVMLKEMQQNKVLKPPLPSIPDGYSTTDLNEVFSLEIISEIAVNNTFEENVEDFVANYLHEDNSKPAASPAAKPAPSPAAKPLGQDPSNSPGAFLTQPSTQHPVNANNISVDSPKEDDDEMIEIEDFNDDYDKDEDNQVKTEKGSKQDDEVQEIIDINDITDSEGEVNDKKESKVDDVIEDDFNDDDEDFIEDEDDKDANEKSNKADDHKSESDAQNSTLSISINSDNFDMNFDD